MLSMPRGIVPAVAGNDVSGHGTGSMHEGQQGEQ